MYEEGYFFVSITFTISLIFVLIKNIIKLFAKVNFDT